MNVKLLLLCSVFCLNNRLQAQLSYQSLHIDTVITGFKFAADFQGTMVYTKNGPADLKSINPSAFSFTLAPKMKADDAKAQLDMLLNMSRANQYKITEVMTRDTTINGHQAYLLSYIETKEGEAYVNFVFNAYVIKDDTAILFVSGDLDKGAHIEKFKKTFFSIQL